MLVFFLLVGFVLVVDCVVVWVCWVDFKKFCSGVKFGGGCGVECLKQYEVEFSDGCKVVVVGVVYCVEKVCQICGGDGDVVVCKVCVKEYVVELVGCKDGG